MTKWMWMDKLPEGYTGPLNPGVPLKDLYRNDQPVDLDVVAGVIAKAFHVFPSTEQPVDVPTPPSHRTLSDPEADFLSHM